MSLVTRASLRYLARHQLQCLLAITGIALGVAIVIGIQATQLAARAAFADALRGVFGQATHFVHAPAGSFDEAVLRRVRRLAPELQPTPVVAGSVRLPTAQGATSLRLVGIDPVSAAQSGRRSGFPIGPFMTEPGAAVLNQRTAERLGLSAGETLQLEAPRATLRLLSIIDGMPGAARVADDLLLVDIATAQEILGNAGRLSRIELHADNSAGAAHALARLVAGLPTTLELAHSERSTSGARELTRAFYTNLDALSLLALLVGAFMIYNTMAFLVVQRLDIFARLRALGVTRQAIARQVAGEALLLGAIGGALGNLLGYTLAAQLGAPLSQTLSDHYFAGGLDTTSWSPALAAGGFVLALSVSLEAAVQPARQAAALSPAQALSHSARETLGTQRSRWSAVAGLFAAVLGVVFLAFSSRSLLAGFAALGAVVVAAMLFVPHLVAALLHATDRLWAHRLPLPERLALKAGRRSLGRIGLAVAALMAATATSIGVGLMVDSFRDSVGNWLEQLLRADFYIAQEGTDLAQPLLDDEHVRALAAIDGVAAISRVRRLAVPGPRGGYRLAAYELPARARAGFRFIAGDAASAWPAWSRGDAVLISEPLAWHHDLDLHDRLRLETPTGVIERPIAGIYQDYGSERGVVALSWQLYTQRWQDERAHGVGVYTAAGRDRERLRSALEHATQTNPMLIVWSNAAIRERSLAVFDRTFAITDVLTLLAAVIAALGVFNALLALHLERAREYAMLRANGYGAAELRRTLYAQTLWVTLATILCAVPLGIGIAVMLIEVINVRSFGWSMQLGWHTDAIVVPALLALLAALAATVYPAERALRIAPAAALRNE
ncbi:MAG: FtsX-like permease family protein [Gammaproteobacteria bacterium]